MSVLEPFELIPVSVPTPPTRHKEKNTMTRLVLEPRPLGPESSAPTILPPPLWVQSHSDHLSGWYCFGYSWNFYSSIQLDCWWTSAANEWDVELNTRREIPYLQATIYYSLFNIHLNFGPLLVSVSMIVYPYFGRISCWLAISNTREKIWYLITAVLGAGNPCLTL